MRRALVLFVLCLGCGSPDEETDGSEITPQQAQADCERFVSNVYCPGFMACLPDFTVDECRAGIDCSTVQGENGKLRTCEAEFKAGTCKQKVGDGTMPSLPLSCRGVFF